MLESLGTGTRRRGGVIGLLKTKTFPPRVGLKRSQMGRGRQGANYPRCRRLSGDKHLSHTDAMGLNVGGDLGVSLSAVIGLERGHAAPRQKALLGNLIFNLVKMLLTSFSSFSLSEELVLQTPFEENFSARKGLSVARASPFLPILLLKSFFEVIFCPVTVDRTPRIR